MAKAKPDDGRVAEHQGRPIFLDTEEGFFYAARDPKEPVHRDNMVRAQALPALKKKLDDLIRSRARLEAGGLELVARVVHDYYWRHRDDEENDRDDEWIAGRYDGVNAHRGEVYLRLPGGERREVTGGYLFIAGDPAIETVRVLARTQRDAQRKLKAADKALEAELDGSGVRAKADTYGHQKSEKAAEAETALLEALEARRAAIAAGKGA